MDKMLSVVLPAYNEEQMIKKTAQVVGDLLEKEQIPYELVFVNDGSKDHTWEKILELKDIFLHISKESAFPEILEKKEPFLQGSHRQKETVLQ